MSDIITPTPAILANLVKAKRSRAAMEAFKRAHDARNQRVTTITRVALRVETGR